MSYDDAHLLDFERAGRITASLAAACLGIDPYNSRQEAWRRITGKAKRRPANPHQMRGMMMERAILEDFEERHGIILLPGGFVPHPTIHWLGASPDGVTTDGHPVEVKAPQQVHVVVPEHYFAQVQIQIACMGTDYGWFYSYVNGVSNMKFKVGHSKQWWAENFPKLEEFYTEYVLGDKEPPRKRRAVK